MVQPQERGHDVVRAAVREDEGEGGVALRRRGAVACPDDVGPGSCEVVRRGEEDGPGAGALLHGQDALVVGVDDGRPGDRQGLEQLALGLRDVLDAAELAGMGRADAEHDAEVRLHERREVRDVPGLRGAHLDHEVARVPVRLEHGQGDADLSVVGPAGRDGGAVGREDAGEEVLWWWSCPPNR
ncbi:hypothetical protein MN0502_13430 [Arthrobacter sp. MN05-02]|nr:hypothetical protein MN0502_13430 [Arthrobacter sp. MN05-02]